MLKSVIIADDLTGANSTAVLLAQDGFRVGTILNMDEMSQFDDLDVLCLSTNSRAVSPEEAYKRVAEAAGHFKDCKNIFFNKRCDSRLRGNIGIEIDSILETLGDDTIAVVVTPLPDFNRTCVGDILFVDGVPLGKTDVTKDAITPVFDSCVTKIVKQQSKFDVGYVSLRQVLDGVDSVKEAVLSKAKTKRIIVVDAASHEDIRVIAKGCVETKLRIVGIDPGPFTASMVHEQYYDSLVKKNDKKILLGIGSATPLTRKQIKALKEKTKSFIVKTDTVKFFNDSTREQEVDRIVNEIINGEEKSNVLAVVTTMEDSDVLDFQSIEGCENKSNGECADIITGAVSDIIYKVMKTLQNKIGAVYLSGGDMSIAVCEKSNTVGFDVKDEIVSLAIYGEMLGGEFNNMPIVTKGGSVGDENTIITCIKYLENKM